MKTLFTALIVAASVTAPVAASAGPVSPTAAAAIAHFDASADNQDDRRVLSAGSGATVSTRSGGPNEAQARFNTTADGQDDVRRVTGGIVVSGTPAYGADIFAAVREAAQEDE